MYMKRFKPSAEAAEKKQQEALELLEQGIQQLTETDNWQQYLRVQSCFHRYSFKNVVMILFQCPEATRVAGYRAWQGMGRQVRQGEKAIAILAPIMRQVDDVETGEKARRLAGFKCSSVFDVSQTEGDELPEIYTSLQGDDAGLLKQLEDFATGLNIRVRFEGCLGASGRCMWFADGHIEIAVDSLLPKLHQCKTFAHELGHALMHSEQDYRQHTSKSQLELEAESVAFMVLNHFGLDSGGYSFAYVAHWSGGAEAAIAQIQESGRRIQAAAHQIIDWIETQQSPAMELGLVAA
ncbi:MAG: ImmA/IrrE family metallo-endopeptidase [Aphanocapsa sp. GSE-SYN-MK-11-07L]|nr:ImmA/IrrE family metallo-endopeptidase [Aphanocapsa sp. GSE-SYN-MK-11-07L]